MLNKNNFSKLIKPIRFVIFAVALSVPLTSATQPASASTWLVVSERESGETTYIDADTIRRNGSTVWFWVKSVESSGNYSKVYWSGDCNARSIRLRELYEYTDSGDIIRSRTPGDYGLLKRVVPDSIGEALLERACNSPQAQAPPPVVSQPPINSNPYRWQFPLNSCGDRTSSGTWWPVFINYGNINAIRAKYCSDAISVTRENTGVPAVMLASFSSYEKAAAFAKKVGGEVGQPSPD